MGTSMLDDCGQLTGQLLARLASPERNQYYYGKLLDAYHLELEQRYGNQKRWLLNRLSLGTGVLCGLRVQLSTDGARVRVSAGVAIDGVGREIIVPVDSPPIDVRQPTDACGRPDGPPVRALEEVTLGICYLECEAEPAPALVDPCGDGDGCEHGLVRERYRLSITRGRPRSPSLVSAEQCSRIFAQPPEDTSRRVVACQTLGGGCDAEREPCVPLAVIRFDDDGRPVEPLLQCEARRVLYSNAVLFDLILCLARRVDECCGQLAVRSLLLVSGDQQVAPAGSAVAQPLVVRVVDGGAPVGNEDVTFDVVADGGAVGETAAALGPSLTVATNAQGIAACPVWRLGQQPGEHRVTARIASGTPAMVTFVARAERTAVMLPVVRRQWPTPAVVLDARSGDPVNVRWFRDWIGAPRIELSFNVPMRQEQLKDHASWLRVSLVRSFGTNEIEVRPVALTYEGPAAQPVVGQADEFTELFALRGLESGQLLQRETRVLVQMLAENGSIVDLAAPPRLLDAEFLGARMGRERRAELFALAAARTFPQDVWDALGPTGATLPQSGDGAEGGEFISWFGIEPLRDGPVG